MQDDPAAAGLLRQAGLHRETAALLEVRARQVASPGDGAGLMRRAAQRRQLADRLLGQVKRMSAEARHPSAMP